MNYTLEVHGEKHSYPLPPGLGELVSDITREVLRHQPTDLYKFIAEYLESLLRIRNAMNIGVKFRTQVVKESTDFVNHFLICGFSHDDLTAAATVIQKMWRGFLTRKKLKEDLECRKKNIQRFGERILDIADDLNVALEELFSAANVIQKYFKDYLDRTLRAPPEKDIDQMELERELYSMVSAELKGTDVGGVTSDEQLLEDLSENDLSGNDLTGHLADENEASDEATGDWKSGDADSTTAQDDASEGENAAE